MDFGRILKGAGDVLATVAPTIATAFGGPLAGTAVGSVLSALGLGADTDAETLEKAIKTATPEQLLALKKADQDFQIRMKELDIEVIGKDAEDRNSARNRQVQMHDHAPEALATLIIAGFFGSVYAVFAGFVEGLKDPLTSTLVGTLIGYVSAKADQVVSYYFGSSKGSRDKDLTIGKLTK
jgi:translation elongation factor EF-1beta